MMECECEDVIDDEITDTVQKLLAYFQSEHGRITENFRTMMMAKESKGSVGFGKNAEFFQLLNRLLETPFGDIAAIPEKSPYDSMQVLAIVKGQDGLNEFFEKPISITTVPNTTNFAILHSNNKLSFVTCSGRFLATYKLDAIDGRFSSTVLSWPFLTADPVTENLILADRGVVSLIQPIRSWQTGGGTSFSMKRISALASLPSGFVLSANCRKVFTGFGKSIYGMSVDNKWTVTDSVSLNGDDNFLRVLGIRDSDNKLFYTTNKGKILHSVAVYRDRPVNTAESQIVSDQFQDYHAMKFDADGNIFTICKGHIKVLSPDASKLISSIDFPNSGKFLPTDIALLSNPVDGIVFKHPENGTSTVCSTIIAAPDYAGNCLVYFGCPKC